MHAFIRENVPLASYTTFGIGGPARLFAEPATTDELRQALTLARDNGMAVKVLGGGSNTLVADGGVDGMVVHLSPKGEFGAMGETDGPLDWTVGAAVPLQSLVGETARKGVAGVERLAGIPGTVGGAVTMNCGAVEWGIGELVTVAEVIASDGQVRELRRPELTFSYRSSAITDAIATRFTMRFTGSEAPHAVMTRMREQRERKRAGQPLAIPSSGCIFRNPPGDSAGSLIDQAGCKGMREGGATVSTLHGNFIVNDGDATCRDVVTLACRVRDQVWERHGVELRPEVVMWGDAADFQCLMERRNADS